MLLAKLSFNPVTFFFCILEKTPDLITSKDSLLLPVHLSIPEARKSPLS